MHRRSRGRPTTQPVPVAQARKRLVPRAARRRGTAVELTNHDTSWSRAAGGLRRAHSAPIAVSERVWGACWSLDVTLTAICADKVTLNLEAPDEDPRHGDFRQSRVPRTY